MKNARSLLRRTGPALAAVLLVGGCYGGVDPNHARRVEEARRQEDLLRAEEQRRLEEEQRTVEEEWQRAAWECQLNLMADCGREYCGVDCTTAGGDSPCCLDCRAKVEGACGIPSNTVEGDPTATDTAPPSAEATLNLDVASCEPGEPVSLSFSFPDSLPKAYILLLPKDEPHDGTYEDDLDSRRLEAQINLQISDARSGTYSVRCPLDAGEYEFRAYGGDGQQRTPELVTQALAVGPAVGPDGEPTARTEVLASWMDEAPPPASEWQGTENATFFDDPGCVAVDPGTAGRAILRHEVNGPESARYYFYASVMAYKSPQLLRLQQRLEPGTVGAICLLGEEGGDDGFCVALSRRTTDGWQEGLLAWRGALPSGDQPPLSEDLVVFRDAAEVANYNLRPNLLVRLDGSAVAVPGYLSTPSAATLPDRFPGFRLAEIALVAIGGPIAFFLRGIQADVPVAGSETGTGTAPQDTTTGTAPRDGTGEEPEAQTGTLSVRVATTGGPWGVWVDDVQIEMEGSRGLWDFAPLSRYPLPAGSHRVCVEDEAGNSVCRAIEIRAGEDTRQLWRLSE